MKIKKTNYKGVDVEIHLASDGDWGIRQNHFYAVSDTSINFGFYQTFDGMICAIESKIDEYLLSIPQSDEDWINAISSCVVQDGYEDWHISVFQALHTLELASKHFRGEKKETEK